MCIIEKGANFSLGNSGGENPLTYAAKKNQIDIVLFLIEQGEDLNYQENNYGMTPLLHASEYGDVNYIKKLLKKGADFS